MSAEDLKPYIAKAADGPLTRAEAEAAFGIIMDGQATPSQIGGFLMALRTRGETVDEYAAAAAVMRSKCTRVTAPAGAMDIVGTGGAGKPKLNISTATALVVAGSGVVIAKHGNRKLTSNSGAGDVLSELGLEVMLEAPKVQEVLDGAGIAFMMAPMHHPAVRHVMPSRQELGTRTIFNILGPLTNPAGVTRQLTGAFSASLIEPMAEVLATLGSDAAWIVHGHDGTDELSICGPSDVARLANGKIDRIEVVPADAGLDTHPFEAIAGGTPAQNAAALRALLEGETSAYRDAVLLNAAAALIVADRVTGLEDGVAMARESIDSGAAKNKLDLLVKLTHS